MDAYFNTIAFLVENPRSKKAYRDFAKYFELKGQKHEAAAIQQLLEKRFANSYPDKEQRKND